MNKTHSPHPFRPAEICLTRNLVGAKVYGLPDGLPPGVRVRTVSVDHGFWTVEEIAAPTRR